MVRTKPVIRAGILLLAICVMSASSASAAATNLFARVAPNGTLLGGNGVTSVSGGFGTYEVTFNKDVSGCAYLATPINSYAGAAITVFAAGGHLGPNGVYVETKNQGGGVQAGGFNLVVVCTIGKMFYAVVGYSADLVRSTTGVVLTPLGAGRYNLTFAAAVKACAFIATVADPGNALVFSPAGVYTGSGPNANTVYVETKNPAGGLQDGIPFHLGVICNAAKNAHVIVADSTGVPKRGTMMASTFKVATGQFLLSTGAPTLANCAVVATRGSADTGVPFNPATIETTPGAAVNTTGLEVRALGFFGGALTNEAFHVAAVCK